MNRLLRPVGPCRYACRHAHKHAHKHALNPGIPLRFILLALPWNHFLHLRLPPDGMWVTEILPITFSEPAKFSPDWQDAAGPLPDANTFDGR